MPVFVNELNKDALSTYLENRHHKIDGKRLIESDNLHCNDVGDLKRKRLDQLKADLSSVPNLALRFGKKDESTLDLLAGGPPCQGFSGIGIRRSNSVDKKDIPSNKLYMRMADVIQNLQPRIFLFENVRGLLWAKWTKGGNDEIWPDVLKEFRSIKGYDVRWSLVHANDYGVPQNRPRVLLVGMRRDVVADSQTVNPKLHEDDALTCGFLPRPDPEEFPPDLEDLLGDLVDNSVLESLLSGKYERGKFETTKYPRAPKTIIQNKLREVPDWVPGGKLELTEQEYSKHAQRVVEKFQYMIKNGGDIPNRFQTKKFAQRVLPKSWGNGAPTITATSLPDDYVHFSQPRILTVREWARLQLFPDWYQFMGKRTTGGLRRAGNPREGLHDREVPKYTQIGNAVPVGLAQRVGEHFKKVLDEVF